MGWDIEKREALRLRGDPRKKGGLCEWFLIILPDTFHRIFSILSITLDGSIAVSLKNDKFLIRLELGGFYGAAGENRTLDPTLTKGVLYH
jgi:hypothetical protein